MVRQIKEVRTVEVDIEGEEWTMACETDENFSVAEASSASSPSSSCCNSDAAEWKMIRDEGEAAALLALLEQISESRRHIVIHACYQTWQQHVEFARLLRESNKKASTALLRNYFAAWRCSCVAGQAGVEDVNSPAVPTSEASGVARLMAMGFSEGQARRAWQASHGSVEKAVQFLIDGRERLQTLLLDARQRLCELKDQLRKAMDRSHQQLGTSGNIRNEAHQRLLNLHSTLAEIRSRLAKERDALMESMQDGTDNFRHRLNDFNVFAQENIKSSGANEALASLDAKLADAHEFLAETLQALRARAAATFSPASDMKASDEAIRAAMEASEHAADVAIAGVLECPLLMNESSHDCQRSSKPSSTEGSHQRTGSSSCATGCRAACRNVSYKKHEGFHGLGKFVDGLNREFIAFSSCKIPQSWCISAPLYKRKPRGAIASRQISGNRAPVRGNNSTAHMGAIAMSHEDDVMQLTAMGFAETDVRAALAHCRGRKEVAISNLLEAN
jgi:hypothetical protein